jgi:hypothetical protein
MWCWCVSTGLVCWDWVDRQNVLVCEYRVSVLGGGGGVNATPRHIFILDYTCQQKLVFIVLRVLRVTSAIIGTKGRNLFVGLSAVNEYHEKCKLRKYECHADQNIVGSVIDI